MIAAPGAVRLRWLFLAWLLTCLASPAQAATTVRFEADMSAEIGAGRFDPRRDALGLRGDVAPLSWERGLIMRAVGPGRFELSVRFEGAVDGRLVAYKFRIERPTLGPDEGWEPGRNHVAVLQGEAQGITRKFGDPPAGMALRRTGHIDRLGLVPSRHVAPREVQVWLPPGYFSEPGRRYPVLYLHDGQNVFDAAAAGAEWGVDETAQRLVERRAIDPPIVVAVASGPDRLQDYTPTAAWVSAERLGRPIGATVGGGAPSYARFLLDELKPLIDARYATRSDAASTAVGGSSLGGLVSLWMAMHHPAHVGAALVVSPSVWWDDGHALRDVRATGAGLAAKGVRRPRIWLDMGAQEGQRALDAARDLHQALRLNGWQDAELRYVEDPAGRHDEASWAGRVEGMMLFLHPPRH